MLRSRNPRGASVAAQRDVELAQLIADENLDPAATSDFIARAFRDGATQTAGVAIKLGLPPVRRLSPGGGHGEKKQRVPARLAEFSERYFELD